MRGWDPRGVILKVIDCGIVVSEFEANALEKGIKKNFILLTMG